MIISCVQMDVHLNQPDMNFARAEALVRKAARGKPDVIMLPETFNTGFAPLAMDYACADDDGMRTKIVFSRLARELDVNIVAGSVARRSINGMYNTAYVFDRAGNTVAEYDKTHLFSPAGEELAFSTGISLARFTLDDVSCALMTCYDLRFPELARVLALEGLSVLFLVAAWPKSRIRQMKILARARAIENQCVLALCNSCGEVSGVRYGGCSAVYGASGQTLAAARFLPRIIRAHADIEEGKRLREAIPIWKDRRPYLYDELCVRKEPVERRRE